MVFASMKHKMIATKASLDDVINPHKESVQKARAIESHINVCFNYII